MKKVLAVIPARSGSKRIKEKNIKFLNGKPMIAWTIGAALESGIFSDVIVSTDGVKIAEVAREFGAQVPFMRKKELSDDFTSVNAVTVNALEEMEILGKKYDAVVQLMPNCPCRTADDIKFSFQNFNNVNAFFQVSVFKFGWMNPWWAMKMNQNNEGEPLFPENFKKRSQDMEDLYCPTGAIWIARTDYLKKEKTFYGKGYKIFPMNWKSAVDIDDVEDFNMAEIIMAKKNNKDNNE